MCSCFCTTCVRRLTRNLRVLMFPSCVPPPNNISFKATAKTFQPLPSLPPSLPLSLLLSFHPHRKKVLIARQRSIIKTYVYTRVSFMDQDLERGEGGAGRHMSAVSTMLSSEQPSSVSSPLFWNWILCTFRGGQKTSNNAAIQHVICLFLKWRSVIQRHLEYRSDRSSAQYKFMSWLLMERIFLIRPSCQDKSVYIWRKWGRPSFDWWVKQITTEQHCHRKPRVWTERADHSPGNRNAGVSTRDHAVLLFRVDHVGGNGQRRTGVNYWPGSVDNKKIVKDYISAFTAL